MTIQLPLLIDSVTFIRKPTTAGVEKWKCLPCERLPRVLSGTVAGSDSVRSIPFTNPNTQFDSIVRRCQQRKHYGQTENTSIITKQGLVWNEIHYNTQQLFDTERSHVHLA